MNRLRPFLFSLFACLNAITCIYAQEYTYTHYTTKDGLAGETVYGMMQDHDGFIWFTTETGLSRFDGRKFKNFTTKDGLPTNEVFGTHEDFRNRLWIYSFSNDVCYYKDGKIFTRHNDPFLSKLPVFKEIKGIALNNRKEIIIWDEHYTIYVIDSNDHLTRHTANTFSFDYTYLKEYNGGGIGMVKLPPGIEEKVLKAFGPGDKNEIMIKKAQHALIFNTKNRFVKTVVWYPAEEKILPIRNPDIYAFQFFDTANILALRPGGGACIYNLPRDTEVVSILRHYRINMTFTDQEKNIWFCTKGNGVFKIGRSKIINYELYNDHIPPVQFIINIKNHVFVGTDENSYWEILPSGKKTDAVPAYQKKKIRWSFKELLRNERDQFICTNHKDFKLTGYLKTAHIFNDTILAATSSGLFLCTLDGSYCDSVYAQRTTVAVKYNNQYYIGTLSGLLIADQNHKILSKPLPYRISYIIPGKNNTLWIATYDDGIFKIKNDRVVDSINRKNCNITSDRCRCIYMDGDYLWAGTDQGLNKIKVSGLYPQVEAIYTSYDGLNSGVVDAILIKDSIIYVGTSKGLNIFTEQAKGGNTLLNLKFTNIFVSDTPVHLNEEPILPHWNNRIKLDFSAISFSLENIIYQYRVSGLDENWQSTSEQSLSFLSLPSGTYTLQIRAVSPLGHKSEIIEKRFEVKQALFEKWWFWVLIIAAIASVLFMVVRSRINKIRKEEEEKNSINRKMIELEQLALRAQMNPHFIFNCLNSIQNYILKQDTEGANYYLSQFAGLVRETLENSPKLSISLREEISYLKHYIELEKLQANHPFEYTIDVAASIDPIHTLLPNMILQPFVENAIKHGLNRKEKDGLLKIVFTTNAQQDMMLCVIEDNGPGIDAANKTVIKPGHTPKGMSLTSKRIETLNLLDHRPENIEVSVTDLRHEGSGGTKVTISIPIKTNKDHNENDHRNNHR